MNTHTIIGYVLLAVGILLIVVPLFQAFNVLTGRGLPPEIFKTQKVELNKNISPTDFQKQIENAFMKTLPVDMLYQSFNLIVWSMLMLVFMFGGKQIAAIGVQLLKH